MKTIRVFKGEFRRHVNGTRTWIAHPENPTLKPGDYLIIGEWDLITQTWTGKSVCRQILDIATDCPIHSSFMILSLGPPMGVTEEYQDENGQFKGIP